MSPPIVCFLLIGKLRVNKILFFHQQNEDFISFLEKNVYPLLNGIVQVENCNCFRVIVKTALHFLHQKDEKTADCFRTFIFKVICNITKCVLQVGNDNALKFLFKRKIINYSLEKEQFCSQYNLKYNYNRTSLSRHFPDQKKVSS